MKLTKFSQRNLNVIFNFLLYAGIEDEYTQVAKDYIEEDHVDGEGSPEALLEATLGCELLLEDIFLAEDQEEKFPCSVYYNRETGLIHVISTLEGNKVSLYKLIKEQEVIEVEHRYEILYSRLSKVTAEDEVSLGDIFMHGGYIKKIYPLD